MPKLTPKTALNKEINRQKVNLSPPSIVVEKSATNSESSVPVRNINSDNQTNKNQTYEYRQHLVNEIVRISRESAAKQSTEISPQAWKALKAEITNDDAANREPGESQKQELASNFAAPDRETLEAANFIAGANDINPPQFASKLDAKVWVMTSLPDTGRQLFLENYIDQTQGNATQLLEEMQKIQLNESLRFVKQQSDKLNQEINQAEINKIWQNLQQAMNTLVNSQMVETVRQYQSENGKRAYYSALGTRCDSHHADRNKR